MLPVFVIRPFENGTSCSYYECVKDVQEHTSDGLVTDALMLESFLFFSTPGDWSLHYTSEYVCTKHKKTPHDSVKSRNELCK